MPKWMDSLGDGVRQAIRAYHGSPYDFDKFDASKIGTGEGAQAYGHGLYFAGSEGVARSYRDSLSPRWVDAGGSRKVKVPSWITDRLLGDPAALRDMRNQLLARGNSAADVAGVDRGEIDVIDAILGGRGVSRVGGRVYEVEIGHPESALLDWDAPMSQQPRSVQRAFGDMAMDMPGDGRRVYQDIATRRGEEFDDDMTGTLANISASRELLDEGIPGIRYLDAGSRRAGEGTRNYVIFPGAEDQIRILRKYGLLAPLPAAAAMSGEE